MLENGAKWRFFKGLKRHFAVSEADGASSQPASLPTLTSVEPGCIGPPPAPPIGSGAPFFTDVGMVRHVRAMTAGRTIGFTHPT